MPSLIRNAHVYLAAAPLYRIEAGKQTFWAATTWRKKNHRRAAQNVNPDVQRFKAWAR